MFGDDVKYLGHSPGVLCLAGLLFLSLSFLPACSPSSSSDSSSSSLSSSSEEASQTASTSESAESSDDSKSSEVDLESSATSMKKTSGSKKTTRAKGFEQGPSDVKEKRTFQLTDQFTIKPPEDETGMLRAWLEVPLKTSLQDVETLNVDVRSDHKLETKITEDPEMGNRFLYFEKSEVPEKPIKITVTSRITRRSVNGFYGPKSLSDAERTRYLRKTSEIPVGQKMKELAEEKGAKEANLASLRAIYDFVVENSTYYKSNPSRFSSSGRGSAEYCLFQKQGGCTDFHALYLSMGRSIDIPSRFLIGSYLPPFFEGKDRGVSYHCWAEAHLDGKGWYALDAAYGDLWPELLDFYFGSLEARRVTFSRGRTIDLVPRASEKVNYFIKGHLELGGNPYDNWSRKLTYREVK